MSEYSESRLWAWPVDLLGPQLFVGDRPDPGRFQQPTQQGLRISMKPAGGLWTSSLRPDDCSEWVEWCRDQPFGDVDRQCWWRLDPRPGACVLVINRIRDLEVIYEQYPYRLFGQPDLDFEAIRDAGWAGIHLTSGGQVATRFPAGPDRPHLSGWDTESTLWLHWCFVGEPILIHPGGE